MATRRARRTAEDPRQILLFPIVELVKTIDAKGDIAYKPGAVEVRGVLTPQQVARALGCSRRAVYDWLSSGVIPGDMWHRHGPRKVYIDPSVMPILRTVGKDELAAPPRPAK